MESAVRPDKKPLETFACGSSDSDTVDQPTDYRASALAANGYLRKSHCRRQVRRLESKPVPVKAMADHRPNDGTTTKGNPGSLHSQKIADHVLLRRIGGGSYGEVWLGRNVMGAHRAIKIIYRKTFADARPFEREFAGLKRFEPISRSHPGWVSILHVGRDEEAGFFYYVMEAADDIARGQAINAEDYAPKTLASELAKRGRLPLDECLRLGMSLAAALGQLHSHGLIHRDVKPSNIIFVNAVPKLADIGLVTDMGGTGKTMTYIGTDGYIAPEGPGTAAADIYSLGKVMYEASMGRDRQQFPELPTSLADRTDAAALVRLNSIILKACEENVAKRYQSASELRAVLLDLQGRCSLPRGPK